MTKLIALYFLLHLMLAPAAAQVLTLENRGEEQFCQALSQAQKKELTFQKRLLLIKELLLLKYAPAFYSRPAFELVPVAKHASAIAEYSIKSSSNDNIIFLPGPLPKDWQAFNQDPNNLIRYQTLTTEKKRLTEQLKKLFKQKNISACQKMKTELGFSYQRYTRVLEELGQMPWKNQQIELESILPQLQKLLPKLKQKWQVVTYTALSEVFSRLRHSSTGNVVIVSHGKHNGHLIDSNGSTYPLGLFAEVAPELFSLSLFSCYSDKSLELYQVKKSLSSSFGIWEKRLVSTVKEHQGAFTGEVAPLGGLRSYLKKLDKKISKVSPGTKSQNIGSIPARCQFEVENASIAKGDVMFALNRQLVGVMGMGERTRKFSFPCDFLKSGNNLMVVTALEAQDNHAIVLDQASFLVDGNTPANRRAFYNPDQTFRSLILTFWRD